MLIPSIDLMKGRVVQMVQGERLALESDDLDGWVSRFSSFPLVQVIDLDAAMGRGENASIVADLCRRLPCQVGGGIRSIDRARELIDAGANRVILGSSLFASDRVRITAAEQFREALGPTRLVAAVDSRAGMVTIHGWKTTTSISAVTAVQTLSPFVGTFLYTHVDVEGTMRGLDFDSVVTIASATTRKVVAAGGVKSTDEVDRLDRLGIDTVVGMAVYTGAIAIS